MKATDMLGLMLLLLVCVITPYVSGHGRLWEPPGRSTMWRRGFKTPANYDDTSLYCGGFQHQVSQGYKCGTCGDPYDQKEPRQNEAGGKYGNGIITRTYTQGQKTTFTVDITANHLGYFEFKICPTNHKLVKATHDCFDLHPVTLADGSGSKYTLGRQSGMVDVQVSLPSDLWCDFCVLQWRYHTGNSWGTDQDTGISGLGHGHQEEFYGCSDIQITPVGSHGNVTTPKPTTQKSTTKKTTIQPTTQTTTKPTTPQSTTQKLTTPQPTTHQVTTERPTTQTIKPSPQTVTPEMPKPSTVTASCHGAKGKVVYDDWCQHHCPLGNCPTFMCECVEKPQTTIKPTPQPNTQAPKPTTQAPKPTTQAPKPTTQAPKPTTQTPKPTTQAPKPTTQAPKPTTQTAKPASQTSKPVTPQKPTNINSCHGAKGNVVYDDWCNQNCPRGICPQHICECGDLNPPTVQPTTQTPKPTTKAPKPQTHKPVKPINCYGARGNVVYNEWCHKNCQLGNCPRLICACGDKPQGKPTSSHCTALGAYRKLSHMNMWCNVNCKRGYCPASVCKC